MRRVITPGSDGTSSKQQPRMRKRKTVCCSSWSRRFQVLLIAVGLIFLAYLTRPGLKPDSKPSVWAVDSSHRKLVHAFVKSILRSKCRPAFTRRRLESSFNSSGRVVEPFLWSDTTLTEPMFQYPPPFGFRDMRDQLREVLSLLPSSEGHRSDKKTCQRCVVVGNGGVLRDLQLGPLIDQFDIVIRLNSGPVRDFHRDVGNRTSIRMSYPEGSPTVWEDEDPSLQFVTAVYKSVDFSWLRAMITGEPVSFWDWLFFWQKVPDTIPIKMSQFRILNPEIIRETALDLLQFPNPHPRLWGWDQNVPTLGVSALTLASYLCDEVSLAGFGYNLSQKEAPLHYYDSLPMVAMLQQAMHNVDSEGLLLKRLSTAGTISDLTGGVHCSFCPS